MYLLGESWHSSQSLVGNGQFNAVMNYPLTQPILALFNGQLNLEDYVGKTNLELMMYRQPNQQATKIMRIIDVNGLVNNVIVYIKGDLTMQLAGIR
ncbi:hypothetical protein WP50_00985, partial [Lactiplantibacillus plantarum]